jgi:hypothetical protein
MACRSSLIGSANTSPANEHPHFPLYATITCCVIDWRRDRAAILGSQNTSGRTALLRWPIEGVFVWFGPR